MSANIKIENPTTQQSQAVESLAAYLNKPIEKGVLDLGAMKLVKSNKGDAYYAVTSKACSCPAAVYHPGQPCKHQRKHIPVQAKPRKNTDSIRPDMPPFRPVSPLPGEADTVSSMLIDLHDTTDREAAYHEMKPVRDMWPAEA